MDSVMAYWVKGLGEQGKDAQQASDRKGGETENEK